MILLDIKIFDESQIFFIFICKIISAFGANNCSGDDHEYYCSISSGSNTLITKIYSFGEVTTGVGGCYRPKCTVKEDEKSGCMTTPC